MVLIARLLECQPPTLLEWWRSSKVSLADEVTRMVSDATPTGGPLTQRIFEPCAKMVKAWMLQTHLEWRGRALRLCFREGSDNPSSANLDLPKALSGG